MPGKRHYIAIFLVSLCLLVLEISVARLLSVALNSAYAFLAISVAMFGLGLSGLTVYLLPHRFSRERLERQLVIASACFGLTAALGVAVFLQIPIVQEVSVRGFLRLSLIYCVLSVPFFLGGLCVSLLMTHFSAQMGRIYFADLVGAGLGCGAVVLAMEVVPSPHVPLLVAAVVCSASVSWALALRPRPLLVPAVCGAVVCVLIVLGGTTGLYEVKHIKGHRLLGDYVVWNSFSRVSAWERLDFNAAQSLPMPRPVSAYAGSGYPRMKMLDIDGVAWTPMMNFDRNLESIQFLRESILYAVHHLAPEADVLLIGLGGGRDILAALAFGQRSILGIEINPAMRHIVEERFGDYSGRPYSHPGVEVVIDEGRSRLHRIDRKFDVIQLSMIDTLSLNAAGSMVFSENHLYTVEAFREYYEHLEDNGILNLTRFYVPEYPIEVLRLAILGREGWEAQGVEDFEDHIVVLTGPLTGTVLIKKTPYTPAELERLEELQEKNYFRIAYRPGGASSNQPELARAMTTPDLARFVGEHEFLVHAPTDDRPFFWNLLRHRLDAETLAADAERPFHFFAVWNDALLLMYLLLFVVTSLAIVFFLGPLFLFSERRAAALGVRLTAVLLLYFACLGYGFIMIEIPLLQHLILFLGKPVYALSVVLFSLLVFSGVGSLASTRFGERDRSALRMVLTAILALALVYAFGLPRAIEAMLALPTFGKVAITVLLLAPIGLVLGMAYPLGIALLREFGEGLVPWAWAMNGAMSVVASVFAIFLASRIGFRAALLTGIGAYAVALICVLVVERAARASNAGERSSAVVSRTPVAARSVASE